MLDYLFGAVADILGATGSSPSKKRSRYMSTRNPKEVANYADASRDALRAGMMNDAGLDFLPHDAKEHLKAFAQERHALAPTADRVNNLTVEGFYTENQEKLAELKTATLGLLEKQQAGEPQPSSDDEKKALKDKHEDQKKAVEKHFEKIDQANKEYFHNLFHKMNNVRINDGKNDQLTITSGANEALNGRVTSYSIPIDYDDLNKEFTTIKASINQYSKTLFGDSHLKGMLDRNRNAHITYNYDPKTGSASVSGSVYVQLAPMSKSRNNDLTNAVKSGDPSQIYALASKKPGPRGREALWKSIAERQLENGRYNNDINENMNLEQSLEAAEALLIHGKGMIPLNGFFDRLERGQIRGMDAISKSMQDRIDRVKKLREITVGNTQEARHNLGQQNAAIPQNDYAAKIAAENRKIEAGQDLRQKVAELGNKLKSLDGKQKGIDSRLSGLDKQYRAGDRNEKAVYDELIKAGDTPPAASLSEAEKVCRAIAEEYAKQYQELQQAKAMAQDSIDMAKAILADLDAKVAAGELSPVDVHEAQVKALEQLKQGKDLLAGLERTEGALNTRHARLKFVASQYRFDDNLKQELEELDQAKAGANSLSCPMLKTNLQNAAINGINVANDFKAKREAEIKRDIQDGKLLDIPVSDEFKHTVAHTP